MTWLSRVYRDPVPSIFWSGSAGVTSTCIFFPPPKRYSFSPPRQRGGLFFLAVSLNGIASNWNTIPWDAALRRGPVTLIRVGMTHANA